MRHGRVARAVGCALLVSLGAAVRAQDAAPSPEPSPSPEPKRLRVGGFVDAIYAYNFNRPADGANFYPGVGTNAKRHNEFSLNLANVDLVLDPEPVGFRLTLAAGTATEVVHAAEISQPGVSADVWRHVQYAVVGYKADVGRGLLLEGGIYPCHVGFESLPSRDNWNTTRSWLGELSPYYVAGVKAAYSFDDRWSAQLHLLNGWQNVGETNDSKTLGTQVSWNSPRVSVSLNTLIGRELPDDEQWRVLGDLLVTVKPTDALSIGAAVDLAREGRPAGDDVSWFGIAGYLRWQAAPRWALAVRGDLFDDDDGAISGTAQELSELTGTLEYKPRDNFLMRLEARQDWSTAFVFGGELLADGTQELKKRQFLLLVNAVASF
jgi:hypothetical protein